MLTKRFFSWCVGFWCVGTDTQARRALRRRRLADGGGAETGRAPRRRRAVRGAQRSGRSAGVPADRRRLQEHALAQGVSVGVGVGVDTVAAALRLQPVGQGGDFPIGCGPIFFATRII